MEAALETPYQKPSHHYPYFFNKIYTDDHPQTLKPLPETQPYDGLQVSEKEYWQKYYEESDVALEWNNGILEEKPVSDKESYDLYAWFHRLISQYNDTFNEGSMIGLEIGFRLDFGDKVTIRKPDLAFIHKNNPDQMHPLERSYKGCFDICFEFLSDSNQNEIKRDTVVKKHEYEKFGVREYYILDRLGDETAFYYLNSKGLYKPLKPNRYGILKSKILKYFQFRVEDLYNRPSDKQLVKDSVYQKYIMVDYQKAYTKAIEANKRTEIEKIRAETERKKAEEADKRAKDADKRAKDADKRAEAERKKAEAERKKAEAERKKAEDAYNRAHQMELEIQALKNKLAMK